LFEKFVPLFDVIFVEGSPVALIGGIHSKVGTVVAYNPSTGILGAVCDDKTSIATVSSINLSARLSLELVSGASKVKLLFMVADQSCTICKTEN